MVNNEPNFPNNNNPEINEANTSREKFEQRGEKATDGKSISEINKVANSEKEKIAAAEKEKIATAEGENNAASKSESEKRSQIIIKELQAMGVKVDENTTIEQLDRGIEKLIKQLQETGVKVDKNTTIEQIDRGIEKLNKEIIPEKQSQPEQTANPLQSESNDSTPSEAQAPESESNKAETEKIDPEKIKKHKGLRSLFLKASALALASVLVAGAFFGNKNGTKGNGPINTITKQSQLIDEEDDGLLETKEAEKGIKDGYDEKGMWLSEHKSGPFDFGSATEIAEVCDDDEIEMTKYTAKNQVESFADYLANMPEELQPEGFKGLNILETESKLESLSDEEFAKIQKQFNENMDKAQTRKVDLDNNYQNAYMRQKDANGDTVHDNMELVSCATTENNKRANQFYWLDAQGNEIGSMTIKILYDENGNIIDGCMQVINQEGSKPGLYTGMETVADRSTSTPIKPVPVNPGNPSTPTPNTPTPTPDTPTPTPEPTPTPTPDTPTPTPEPTPTPTPDTPTPTPAPKNLEAEQRNAGDVVTPLELNEQVTPATTIEQDQANFEAIQQQQAEDQARAEEAARIAAEQAAREQAAAAEAEQRRQAEEAARQAELAQMQEAERQQREAAEAEARRAAEEAARAAAEQAAREQAAAAEAERARAAEEAARQQAQQEANNQAQANSEAATANEDATAEQRADMFANGDF